MNEIARFEASELVKVRTLTILNVFLREGLDAFEKHVTRLMSHDFDLTHDDKRLIVASCATALVHELVFDTHRRSVAGEVFLYIRAPYPWLEATFANEGHRLLFSAIAFLHTVRPCHCDFCDE